MLAPLACGTGTAPNRAMLDRPPPHDTAPEPPAAPSTPSLPTPLRPEPIGCQLEGDDVVARFFSDQDEVRVDHAAIEVGKDASWMTLTRRSFVFEGPISNRRIDVRLKQPVTFSPGFRALGATLASNANESVASLAGLTIAPRQQNAPTSKEPSFSCADIELFHPSSTSEQHDSQSAQPRKADEPPTARSTPKTPAPPPVPQQSHIGMPTSLASSPGGAAMAQVQRCIPVSVLEKRGTNVRVHYVDRFVDVTGWVPSVAVRSLPVMRLLTNPLDPLTCADLQSPSMTPWGSDELPSETGGFVVSVRETPLDKWSCPDGIAIYRKTTRDLLQIGIGRGVLRILRGPEAIREVLDVPIHAVVRAEDLRRCSTP